MFSGEGAFQRGGRWNTPRQHRVCYTSESLALAVLEMLVHTNHLENLSSWVCAAAVVPQRLITKINPVDLPRDWRGEHSSDSLRAIGDDWLTRRSSAVLQVPTALLPHGWNFLLNPAHADFGEIEVDAAQPLDLDRLRQALTSSAETP